MIIISQEKDAILNFDNVITIRTATDIESKKERLVAIDTIDGERYYIAKYATEERAKEVLREIIDTYKFNRKEAVGQVRAFYEMPKE